jgi:DNA mismatch repair protein MutL
VLQQPLLISVVRTIDEEERDLLNAYESEFEKAGFSFENYGPDSIALRGIPHCLKLSEAEETFADILEDLKTTGIVDAHLKGFKLMCKTVACHSAVRAGDSLELSQMQKIVENWSRTRNPYTCPHGRPILLKLSKDEINRRFLRTWS